LPKLWGSRPLRAVAIALATCACAGSAGTSAVTPKPSASPQPAGSDVGGTLQVGSLARSYVLHLPPESSRLRPTPLVIAFHGAGITATRMSEITHLTTVADLHGFAVSFPQGVRNSWAVPGFDSPALQSGVDDVAFVRALLGAVGSQYQLDTSRVVATGLSNGAVLTQLLGCSMADRLIGIVPVAGPMVRQTATGCLPSQRISVLEIQGTDDPFVAYDGSAGPNGSLSFTETLAMWARVDACAGAPVSAQLADTAHDTTIVTTVHYSDCASGTEVTGYSIKGGGHAWPGGEPIGSVDQAGVTSRQFDASELIWSFLDRHR
jgi:polyhydroxybutyrate depolymerase